MQRVFICLFKIVDKNAFKCSLKDTDAGTVKRESKVLTAISFTVFGLLHFNNKLYALSSPAQHETAIMSGKSSRKD